MKKILIIGATSGIAEATARVWAKAGHQLFLVARDNERLQAMASDLTLRGAHSAQVFLLDVNDFQRHDSMITAAWAGLGGVDTVLIAHGVLGDQTACEQDAALTVFQFTTNALSVIALLTRLATCFEEQKHGTIAVLSSVAGERGRASNYVYGSAKAAVSTFCEGLRIRLGRVGVQVVDIRPGFVATPMTQGLPLPKLLVAKPEQVAQRIASKLEGNPAVLYVPGFWAWIMLIIRNIPRPIFKRMNL